MSMDYASSGFARPQRSVPVNIVGTVPVSGTITQSPPTATTGTAPTTGRALATNASSAIKGSSGRLFGFIVSNPGAAAAWFNVYNIVTAVVGTTTPIVQVLVPAGGTVDFEPPYGIGFGTGISCAATDTSAVLSAVAPASALVATVVYL